MATIGTSRLQVVTEPFDLVEHEADVVAGDGLVVDDVAEEVGSLGGRGAERLVAHHQRAVLHHTRLDLRTQLANNERKSGGTLDRCFVRFLALILGLVFHRSLIPSA